MLRISEAERCKSEKTIDSTKWWSRASIVGLTRIFVAGHDFSLHLFQFAK